MSRILNKKKEHAVIAAMMNALDIFFCKARTVTLDPLIVLIKFFRKITFDKNDLEFFRRSSSYTKKNYKMSNLWH